MNKKDKQRLVGIIQERIKKEKIEPYWLSKKSKITYKGITNILDGTTKNPGVITLERILDAINKHPEENLKQKIQEPKSVYSDIIGVPYYNVDFASGYESFFKNSLANYDFKIDYEPYNDADFWVNNIGNSMSPKIESGDLVALKEKKDITQIIYGEIYAIVLPEMRTIKYIRKSEKENHVKFVPENLQDFDSQDMPIELIEKFFLVLGSIKKFF